MFENLRYLLRLTAFAGLFFASTVVVPDGGGDGGDAGGDGGAGREGTEGTDEVVEEDTGETEEGVEQEEGTEEEGDGDTGTKTRSNEVPKRPTDAQIKESLAEIRKTDPNFAKFAESRIFKAQDYERVFSNVVAARDARDLIESVGGADGVASLQGEVKEYAAELTKMGQGDPSLIDELARDFPQGLQKLAPVALRKLAEINPEAYERALAGPIAQTLKDKGVANSISRLIELIGDGKQADAHTLATKLANWVQGIEEFSKSQPRQQEESSEMKAVREREQRVRQQEQNTFKGNVAKSVIGLMDDVINRQLAPMLKGKTLSKDQRADLVSGIRGHLSDGFASLGHYQKRMADLLEQGDVRAIERYVRGQLDSDRVSKSVRAIWAKRGFANATKKPTPGTGGGNGNAVVKLAAKPSADQIDWSKDPGRIRFMRGEATLKGGKVVKWAW